MQTWINGLILGSIIPGIVMFFIQRQLTKMSKSLEDKKADEHIFNVIIIKSLLALGENDKAMFEALKSGRTNGNLDRAINNYSQIEKMLDDFLIEKASRD